MAAPETQIEVKLDNEHLIAVVVSRTEERLRAKLEKAVYESRRLGAEAEKRSKRLQELFEAEPIDPGFVRACETFVGQADVIGITLKLELLREAFSTRDLTFKVKARFEPRGGSGYSYLATERTQSLKGEAVTARDELDELKRRQAEQAEIARDSRSRLNEVPLIERRARAKLAEYALRKSAQGNELLDALLANLDAEVDGIPLLKQLETF